MECKFTQLSGCSGSWELARLTTGDAKGDLKSPSLSPFPFPGPSVAWVEHRTELQIFYFTRMERVQLGMLMPRNIFQVVTGTTTSYYVFYLQQNDTQLWNYFLPLETSKKVVFITDENEAISKKQGGNTLVPTGKNVWLMFSADFKVYCTCCDPICYINAQNFTKPVFNWKQSSIPEDSLIKVCLSAEAEEDLRFFELCLDSNLDFWDEVPATLKLAACSHCQQWGQGSTRHWKNCFPECPKSCVGVRTGITISERQISCLKFCILIQPPPVHTDAFIKVSILILT